jgi:hypothetical protein
VSKIYLSNQMEVPMPLSVEQEKINLHQSIDNIPNASLELLAPLLQAVAHQRGIQAVAVARAIGAILKLSNEGHLELPASAPSEFDLLLSLLQHSEVQKVLPSQDPLAQAKIRGLLAQQQLLQAEGGCVTSEEAAKLLGIRRQAIDKRRAGGKLIGLLTGRTYSYPIWQFDQGQTVPGLEATLKALEVRDPWMQTAWMLGGNSRLEGQSPLQALRNGENAKVLKAASAYGQQGIA